MRNNDPLKRILFFSVLFFSMILMNAQVPTCGSNVPFYQVNLTGQPAGVWYSPGHSRVGNCCGTTSPDNCTSFEIILDTGAAMINFNIASGAVPPGSMYYQIGCGPQIAVGHPICIVGPGPHHLTFCKPGNNQNTYFVQSIPKPTFPKPQHVRIGCSQKINVLGLDTPSVTWSSVFPGTVNQYNSYLSCTNGCVSPVYTPAANAPAYVDYKVCGTPIATSCGYVYVCDTVRIYNESILNESVTPNPAGFCTSGSGILLTALGSGGYGAYSYIWRNQSNTIVGNSSTYTATGAGTYSAEVRDELYNSLTCPSKFVSVPVTVTNEPIVSAGPDQTLCATAPDAFLSGSVQYATGGIWSGGAGTFNPNNTTLLASYTPTAAEIASGSVTLILSSNGAGGGCANKTDTVVIHYPPKLTVALTNTTVPCNSTTTVLTPVITGGTAPFSYEWNTGATTYTISAGQGNYCFDVTDNIGCSASACANVVAPAALGITVSETNVTTNGGSNGTATANPSGGTTPYTYSWNPSGQTTQTATGLSYGIYTVTVTDARGCSIYSSIVVNEPRCASFNATVTKSDVLCAGNQNGSADVSVSGGTGPYTYSWNDPSHQTTASASNLGAGTYIVVVTDASGCLFAAGITITQPSQLTNVMNQTNVTSVGGNDGSATSNPFGGTPGYNYSWSNSSTTQTISNLTAGVYVLNLSDNNNCHLIDSVSIIEGDCQNLELSTSVTGVSCAFGNNGSASVTALHGTAPYTYSWNTGATTSSINNLAAGTYVVTVTDAHNCMQFKNVIVTQPSQLNISLAPTPISCFDKNDGTIELSVFGGSFPYAYSWSNGISVEDQVDLSNGSYSVTVTDAKGCSASGSTTIVRPTAISLTSTHTNVTCFGGSDASVDITVGGGVLPYTYSWSNGPTTQDISGLASGQYFVTIKDANGCTLTNTPTGVLIDQPEGVAALSHHVDCAVPGSGIAMVSVVPSGGWASPYTVSFDNGSSFQAAGDYDVLLPVNATYTVVIVDKNGCTSVVADTVKVDPEVAIAAVNFNKCQYVEGAATAVDVTPAGGDNGPYSVSLDNGSNYQPEGTYSFNLPIGNSYDIVVKDGKGCLSLATHIVIPSAFITTSTTSEYNGYNISCNGVADGSINITSAGGTGPYTFDWSNLSDVEDQTGLMAGTYSVVVSDANGCADTLNFSLTQAASFTASLGSTSDFSGFQISCSGLADGTIDMNVNGGVPDYTYLWSNGGTTQDISNLSAGTYSVLVTDLNSCSATFSVSLTEPALLISSVSATNFNGNGVSCNGSSNGAIDLSVSGGVPSYNYNWSNNATSEDISSLSAGTYSVLVTDQNNCTTTSSVTLTEPAPLVSSVGAVSEYNGYQISCNGVTDGSIDIGVSGGVMDYTYNWSNGATTQDLTNIAAGVYSVVVTDANGCTDTLNFNITEPTPLGSSAGATTDFSGYQISCNGMQDGAIDLSVTGGVPAYIYQWSNGSSTQDLGSIAAGTYSVLVTDANTCTTSVAVTLSEPMQLNSSITVTSDYNGYAIGCNGLSDGAVDLNVSGGVLAYSYSWSNGATTEDLSSISAGSYTVVVSDQNNCTSTSTITLSEPTPLVTGTTIVSSYNGYNISCKGLSDGFIDISVSGGVTAYTYNWSNGTAAEDLTGISAGSYSVLVADANGCNASLSFVLNEPLQLASSAAASTDFNGYQVSCNGSNNGAIDLSVNGGVAAYSYQWSDGSTAEDPASLSAGTYSVTVTDLNNCTATSSVVLTEPALLTSSITVTTDYNGYAISCNGMSDGSIDLTVNGGVVSYSYSWSNAATSEDISSVGAGTYSVLVTDQNNCTATTSVVLTEPAFLTSGINNVSDYNGYNISCNGLSDAAIDINVSGGVTGYSFTWSNGAATEDINGLAAGNYNVVITDANNCTTSLTQSISEPSSLTATGVIATDFNGYAIRCKGNSDGAIDITISGGVPSYVFAWSNGNTAEDLNGLAAGTYSVAVNDMNGCAGTLSFTLNQPDSVLVVSTVQDVLCNGFTNGSVDLAVTGGVTPYTYNWSNGTTSQDLTNVSSGIFSAAIIDQNGCSSIHTYTVTESSPLVLNVVHTNVTCNSLSNASVVASVSGGTPAYVFNWSNGSNQSSLQNVGPGNYVVIVSDANQCTKSDSVLVTEPGTLVTALTSPVMLNGFNVSLFHAVDGSISSATSGGTLPYTYSWSNGATTQNLSNIGAGVYTVLVTDSAGCSFTTSIKLSEPFNLEMPTGYSPNGDGKNDFFVVHGIESYPNNVITIFNRWGNEVYSKDNYENTWNGKSNSGDELPDATYFVILKINNGDITLKGYVDLRR